MSWIARAALAVSMLASPAVAAPPERVAQGPDWTETEWTRFYSQDQGSRVIPLAWIAALKQGNGEPFLAESLSRYGYLPNPQSTPIGLPVGFSVTNDQSGQRNLGITCAACHTRQIQVDGIDYRIDGGPAIADFQSLLEDLDNAVGKVLDSPDSFSSFAGAVLGPNAPENEKTRLRQQLADWYLPYHTLMQRALPQPPWGPARIDAVAMIFNRLTGLDIGPPPTYMIPENIQRATAPVRYPFLWNAGIQDKTQWPGFADNGSKILGLARNLGEVYGVFAEFRPVHSRWRVLGVDYLKGNSANFQGLGDLEELVWKIGPPRWPWPVDETLASAGDAIFNRPTNQGGCVDCHGQRPGKTRFPLERTWATPLMDVGTDSREYDILGWTVKTGVLEGKRIPALTEPLQPTDTAFNVLRLSVLGSILQHYVPVLMTAEAGPQAVEEAERSPFIKATQDLKGAFNSPLSVEERQAFRYESRVLEGVWAAAPYLHNGSVPTLVELLKPASERVAEFKIGPAYDIRNVGLAVEQDKFDYTLKTTGCDDRNSGNSRCGHEFGTGLSLEEKEALLEYLKTL